MDSERIDQLLGREFAQRDANFLDYSVGREDILARIRNCARPFYLIVAPRGSGKSGLLLLLEDELARLSRTSSVIIKRYSDEVSLPPGRGPVEASVQFWKTTLLRWIVAEIGVRIDVPETTDEIFAVELAEQLGLRECEIGAPPLDRSTSEADARLPHVVKRLLEQSQKTFWLLLDEMDDFNIAIDERNVAIVGLLQACDAVSKLSPRIVARVTIRPHILTYLKTNFDVVQKFRDAELTVDWSETQLRDVLVRRIQRFDHQLRRDQPQLNLVGPTNDRHQSNRDACRIISRYLADFDSSFKVGSSSDYRALQTLSLRRPRWMIEFCAIALKKSASDFATAVSFHKAMHEYGRNRIQFLAGEHKTQLPDFAVWINRLTAARRSKFGSSEEFRDTLIEYLLRADGVAVAERPASPQEDADALTIAQALYMLEIVRAHQSAGGRDDHRFYRYTESPELLASWSTRANMTWEMHETFSRALNIIDNNTYSVGDEVRLFGERRSGSSGKNRRNRPGSRSRRRDALEKAGGGEDATSDDKEV